MIKLALLSYWHVHAKDYAREADAHPDTEIVAIWDEIPERGRKEAEARNVPFYENLDELLASPDIDGVIIVTPTNRHREVMIAAANAGKHIFTEKVIAPTLHEVNDILQAVEKNGVKLTVSLPRLNDGYTLAIQDVLKAGKLGDLIHVRTRLSHDGALAGWLPEHFFNKEQCGGGALIDLGCHPMYLARLFLGLPESVTATYGYISGKEVEDNAVAVLQYGNGAVAVVEAGFMNPRSPFTIEINGTKGTLVYGAPNPDRIYLETVEQVGNEWEELPLLENREPAFSQWVGHIQNGTTADENIQLAVDLTRLMEASNLAAARKCAVKLNELAE
ncbi:Gfo/Idh/MocA family protein [Gorillibacterium massiliense]|uniref:Gfo/Idh/MocA family protein n=1 Tax=Gorillibacterium massiliense TaxID=1280390 RepID=UPI0004AE04EF|nr:Gfo/Idh/MocA family oxidoreductase [Gorillibacterium massiliense]